MTDAVRPRIAIGIPSRDLINIETAHCLANMVGRFTQLFVATGQAEIVTVSVSGTLLPQMRNSIVEQAMEHRCTHILWIDSDMEFPADSLERLLLRKEAVVGVNYSQRKRPAKPTVARRDDKGGRYWVYTEAQEGIEAVEFIGHGLCLAETSVYEAMPKPWYMLGWSRERQCIIGEDVWFCHQLKRLECPVYVDHDLSRDIGHIGYHTYTMADAVEDRPELIRRQEEGKSDGA